MTIQKDSKKEELIAIWREKAKRESIWNFLVFFCGTRSRGCVLDLWRSLMKECPKKGITFTFKPTSSSNEKCEHCGVDGHDIDHHCSLHLEFIFTKSTSNKDSKGKGANPSLGGTTKNVTT